MHRYLDRASALVAFVACLSPTIFAQGAPVPIWVTGGTSTYAAPQSASWTHPPQSLEAADDFDVQGVVTRITTSSNGCFQCAPPSVSGVIVRFYEWSNGAPGALLYSATIPPGANLLFNAQVPESLDITLPTPFVATGKAFLSIQLAFNGSGYWGNWIANKDAPKLSRFWYRDNLAGGAWGSYTVLGEPLNADLAFVLWGHAGPTPGGTDPCGTWKALSTPVPAGSQHSMLEGVKAFGPDDV